MEVKERIALKDALRVTDGKRTGDRIVQTGFRHVRES